MITSIFELAYHLLITSVFKLAYYLLDRILAMVKKFAFAFLQIELNCSQQRILDSTLLFNNTLYHRVLLMLTLTNENACVSATIAKNLYN